VVPVDKPSFDQFGKHPLTRHAIAKDNLTRNFAMFIAVFHLQWRRYHKNNVYPKKRALRENLKGPFSVIQILLLKYINAKFLTTRMIS